ncbi:MAG: MotA/TolQ/ExbB proton channel family protein [Kofleriaceae bacterium]|nr:MotA/TolQ/ExbB proton channel family protein [Kofleriaceae bacterium]MCL4228574.1 MotA/TolQ/ExbB proton channel family protein [Myxococcales bacterium]
MPEFSSLNAVSLAAAGPDTDIATLIKEAHWIVQGVMALLAAMFLFCLYIIIYKRLYLGRASRESDQFNESFWRSRDIEQIYKHAQGLRNSPISQMFLAGYTELAKLASDERMRGDREGNLENIGRALRKAQTVETTKLESMTPFLATTGAAAPFIGLFGTVVGIMIAFQKIAKQGNASLDTVGQPIAEALLATAIGLVAAIPAVMAYNYFVRRIRVLRSEMETFEQDYLNIIKRHFLH